MARFSSVAISDPILHYLLFSAGRSQRLRLVALVHSRRAESVCVVSTRFVSIAFWHLTKIKQNNIDPCFRS